MNFKLAVMLVVLTAVSYFTIKSFTKDEEGTYITNEVVISAKSTPHDYRVMKHKDSNLDGLITRAELASKMVQRHEKISQAKNYAEYKEVIAEENFDSEVKLKFVQSLNSGDRELIVGLSFEDAKQAIHLPMETKIKALQISDHRAKVKYIKSQINQS